MTLMTTSTKYKVLKKPTETFQRIAFYGPMAVGKSWCAAEVQYNFYHKMSLAGKLKAICYELYGVQGKDDRARKILQDVGLDLRKHDPDVWVKYLLNTIKERFQLQRIVIDDMRFVNEAKYLRENGFILVLVTAAADVRAQRLLDLYPDMNPERQNHASEQEWKEIEPDFVIDSSDAGAATQIEAMLADVTYRPRWER